MLGTLIKPAIIYLNVQVKLETIKLGVVDCSNQYDNNQACNAINDQVRLGTINDEFQ